MDEFLKLKKGKRILIWAIEGLDGAGKATVTSEIVKNLEQYENIIQISFPLYKSKWGKIIKYLLYEDDKNLTVEERMAVYAIDRLQIIDSIKNKAVELAKNSRTIIIFNRYPISSLITYSYYIVNSKYKNLSNKEMIGVINSGQLSLNVWRYIDSIKTLEHVFFKTFGNNVRIYMPEINPAESVTRVHGRAKADKYEDLKVQILANYIYNEAQKFYKGLKLFPQNKRSPEEIANEALNFFGYKPKKVKNRNAQNISISEPLGHSSNEGEIAIAEILSKYPKLRKLENLRL